MWGSAGSAVGMVVNSHVFRRPTRLAESYPERVPRPRSQLVHTAPTVRRSVAAACLGNAVEWYDFAIYGALGAVVTPIFFPSHGGATTLVVAFLVYATAFVMRPLGAALFGVRADAEGRRPVLVTVILLMSLATAGVGLIPGYAAIGVLAPCTLLLLRATQGLAAGGEARAGGGLHHGVGTGGRRGAFGAWHTATLALGLAAGLAVGGLVLLLPAEQVAAGWWRPAFLVALPLGLIGTYLRRRVTEPSIFVAARAVGFPGAATDPPRVGAAPPGLAHRVRADRRRRVGLQHLLRLPAQPPDADAADGSGPSALLAGMVGLLVAAGAALVLGALTDRTGRLPSCCRHSWC